MYNYKEPGTIPKPRIIGRTIRIVLGVAVSFFVFTIVAHRDGIVAHPYPQDIGLWLGLMYALCALSDIVNIGFGKNWGRMPQYLVFGILIVSAILGKFLYHTWWSAPFAWEVVVLLVYFYAHLGISFFLSAILATPGCEMRALPHLWSRLSAGEYKEHFCTGFLDKIDNWERGFFAR